MKVGFFFRQRLKINWLALAVTGGSWPLRSLGLVRRFALALAVTGFLGF